MNETIKNLLERRSVRGYKEDLVPEEVLNEILEAAQTTRLARPIQRRRWPEKKRGRPIRRRQTQTQRHPEPIRQSRRQKRPRPGLNKNPMRPIRRRRTQTQRRPQPIKRRQMRRQRRIRRRRWPIRYSKSLITGNLLAHRDHKAKKGTPERIFASLGIMTPWRCFKRRFRALLREMCTAWERQPRIPSIFLMRLAEHGWTMGRSRARRAKRERTERPARTR